MRPNPSIIHCLSDFTPFPPFHRPLQPLGQSHSTAAISKLFSAKVVDSQSMRPARSKRLLSTAGDRGVG